MISVLMTTYNDDVYLPNSIPSVLGQTFSDFEFVIIDDGSTDNTESTVRSFNDERIHYYKINHVGRSKALNYGLSKCIHDWVAIIDADDFWHSSKLEKQVKLIKSEKDVIFTHTLFFQKNSIEFSLKCPRSKSDLMKLLPLHGHMTNSSIIYNKNYIIKLGSYNESLTNSEDYDLLIRMIPDSTYKFINEYLVFYRLRSESLSSYSVLKTKRNIRMIQEKYFSRSFKKNGILNSEEKACLDFFQEYFYGTKNNARKIWLSNKKLLLKNYRTIIAFFITYLPDSLFEKFLQSRARLRMQYFLKRLFREKKILEAKKMFKTIIK